MKKHDTSPAKPPAAAGSSGFHRLEHPAAGGAIILCRFVRLACVPFALIVLLLISYSCRRTGPVPFPELGEPMQAAGAGIEIRARLLPGEPEIRQLFKWHLPDSNIVPVQVSLRNNDVVPLTVYYQDDILGDESYGGFELNVDGRSARPLHPVNVIQRKMNTDKYVSYRFSKSGALVSTSIIPPLSGYFVYRELKVGRYYRPLFKNSLYRAVSSGMLVPITLEPGETVQGYLYFLLDEENPYVLPLAEHMSDRAPAEDTGKRGKDKTENDDTVLPPVTLDRAFELRVRSYRPKTFSDTIPVLDAAFPRCGPRLEARRGESQGRVCAGGLYLALRRSNGDVSLGFDYVDHPVGNSHDLFQEIASYRSDEARIADAVASGSIVACAVNFKGKSRVYILHIKDGTILDSEQMLLPRRTLRLSLAGDMMFVVTADDFCRAISLKDNKIRRNVRLGSDVRDAALCGDRLIVLDGRRGVMAYGTAGEQLLKEVDRYPLPGEGEMRIIGCDVGSGVMAYLCRGSKGAGDTIIVGMPGGKAGSGGHVRLPLPAEVEICHMNGMDLLFQLEGGLLAHCDLEPVVRTWADIAGGNPATGVEASGAAAALEDLHIIQEAVFLPVILRALIQDRDGIIGIGENGVLVRGTLTDFAPESTDARTSRCRVTVAPRIPEK